MKLGKHFFGISCERVAGFPPHYLKSIGSKKVITRLIAYFLIHLPYTLG